MNKPGETLRPPSASEWRRMAEVARLYWVEGLKVEDVGERLFLSRSTVSRLLARARQCGVVEFTVHPSAEPHQQVAAQISERFGIRTYVAPPAPTTQPAAQVAELAAQHVGQHVGPDITIAVAWGDTVDAVSRRLEPRPASGVTIVQLDGASAVHDLAVTHSAQVLERFSRAYGGSVSLLPMPALFDDPATRDALFRERSLQRALELRRQARVVITSVGSVLSDRPGHLYRAGYLDTAELERLQSDGVVGDVGAVFFRADGTFNDIPVNARSTGLPLDQLRRIPTRLFVVSGAWKAPALGGALAAGLVTDLVIDQATAEALLSLPATE